MLNGEYILRGGYADEVVLAAFGGGCPIPRPGGLVFHFHPGFWNCKARRILQQTEEFRASTLRLTPERSQNQGEREGGDQLRHL
jgi:hypothetical protein